MSSEVENYVIGRLTAFGVVDVLLYCLVAGLCIHTARRCSALRGTSSTRSLDSRFWLITGITLALLALWKAFDVEGVLQDAARLEAAEGAWYEGRRGLQTMIASLGLLAGFGVIIGHFVWFRERQPLVRLASAGLALLIGFIGVRTISLHIVDRILYDPIGPIRLNWIIEPALVLLIGYAAVAFRIWMENRKNEARSKHRYKRDDSGRRL